MSGAGNEKDPISYLISNCTMQDYPYMILSIQGLHETEDLEDDLSYQTFHNEIVQKAYFKSMWIKIVVMIWITEKLNEETFHDTDQQGPGYLQDMNKQFNESPKTTKKIGNRFSNNQQSH